MCSYVINPPHRTSNTHGPYDICSGGYVKIENGRCRTCLYEDGWTFVVYPTGDIACFRTLNNTQVSLIVRNLILVYRNKCQRLYYILQRSTYETFFSNRFYWHLKIYISLFFFNIKINKNQHIKKSKNAIQRNAAQLLLVFILNRFDDKIDDFIK